MMAPEMANEEDPLGRGDGERISGKTVGAA